jgi:hypothetical protein
MAMKSVLYKLAVRKRDTRYITIHVTVNCKVFEMISCSTIHVVSNLFVINRQLCVCKDTAVCLQFN